MFALFETSGLNNKLGTGSRKPGSAECSKSGALGYCSLVLSELSCHNYVGNILNQYAVTAGKKPGLLTRLHVTLIVIELPKNDNVVLIIVWNPAISFPFVSKRQI